MLRSPETDLGSHFFLGVFLSLPECVFNSLSYTSQDMLFTVVMTWFRDKSYDMMPSNRGAAKRHAMSTCVVHLYNHVDHEIGLPDIPKGIRSQVDTAWLTRRHHCPPLVNAVLRSIHLLKLPDLVSRSMIVALDYSGVCMGCLPAGTLFLRCLNILAKGAFCAFEDVKQS